MGAVSHKWEASVSHKCEPAVGLHAMRAATFMLAFPLQAPLRSCMQLALITRQGLCRWYWIKGGPSTSTPLTSSFVRKVFQSHAAATFVDGRHKHVGAIKHYCTFSAVLWLVTTAINLQHEPFKHECMRLCCSMSSRSCIATAPPPTHTGLHARSRQATRPHVIYTSLTFRGSSAHSACRVSCALQVGFVVLDLTWHGRFSWTWHCGSGPLTYHSCVLQFSLNFRNMSNYHVWAWRFGLVLAWSLCLLDMPGYKYPT